jgi:hypothetical protein
MLCCIVHVIVITIRLCTQACLPLLLLLLGLLLIKLLLCMHSWVSSTSQSTMYHAGSQACNPWLLKLSSTKAVPRCSSGSCNCSCIVLLLVLLIGLRAASRARVCVAAGSLLVSPLVQVILVLKKILLLLFVLRTGRVLAATRGLAFAAGELAAGLQGNSSSGSRNAVAK